MFKIGTSITAAVEMVKTRVEEAAVQNTCFQQKTHVLRQRCKRQYVHDELHLNKMKCSSLKSALPLGEAIFMLVMFSACQQIIILINIFEI